MKQIIKQLIYAALIVGIFCVQSVVGYRLMLFGAKPDILPFAAMTAAVLCGHTSGAWLGALAGLLTDACSAQGLGITMPIYFFIGAFGGILTRKYLKKGFISAFLFGTAACTAQQLGSVLLYMSMGVPASLVIKSALGGILFSILLSPVPYLIFRAIDRLLPAPEDYRFIPVSPVIRGFAHKRNGGDEL